MQSKPKRYVFKFLATIEEQEYAEVDFLPTEADQKSVVMTVPIFAYSFEEAERRMQNSLFQALVANRR